VKATMRFLLFPVGTDFSNAEPCFAHRSGGSPLNRAMISHSGAASES
jgi:hypothetical protein